MQGTVKEFDNESRAGSLLTDDGSEVAIDPTSTEGSEIRSLRIGQRDRKSTRLNSSHGSISYAVFCLKKKKHEYPRNDRDLVKLLQHRYIIAEQQQPTEQ